MNSDPKKSAKAEKEAAKPLASVQEQRQHAEGTFVVKENGIWLEISSIRIEPSEEEGEGGKPIRRDEVHVQFSADQADRPEWWLVRNVGESSVKMLTECLAKGRPILGKITAAAKNKALEVSALRFQSGK